MNGSTQEDRGWSLGVVSAVPDLYLEIGKVAVALNVFGTDEQKSLALFQYMMSAIAFQIENPARAKDGEAVDQAGMEGVLRAYENLVRVDQKSRTAQLDAFVATRNRGELPALVRQLRAAK